MNWIKILALMTLLTLSLGCGGGGDTIAEGPAADAVASGPQAPMFQVDPFWPKPLPNHWILGPAIGVSVDSRDHVWIVHRNNPDLFGTNNEIGASHDPPLSECCIPAPPVLEFDPDGNLVGHWGGPTESGEYEWPLSNHGIVVDNKDNVWIGGNGPSDAHILKFSRDGEFLLQLGKAGARAAGKGADGRQLFERDSNDTESFGRVAKVSFDPKANEIYVADGYLNRRVAVLDADTGALKRYWGAYGGKPDDSVDTGRYSPDNPPAKQFRTPVHCADLSNDGLLYVCDRTSDRVQVFKSDGTFVKEAFFATHTLAQGSTWDIAFSRDAAQKYLYIADGQNMKVYIVERETMEVLTSFGDGGRQPGLFFAVHSIATDSKGNIYTTETYEGKRLQKFVYQGLGPIKEKNQGNVFASPLA